MRQCDHSSLYHRLGGVYRIAAMVEHLMDRVAVDDCLNENPFVFAAALRKPRAGFRYLLTEFACWAAGGPQTYTGPSLREAHRHLQITSAEWEAFMEIVQQTLDKFAVPQPEQDEIKASIERTRGVIVTAP